MNSLARYSRANSVNKEWIDLYLNEAHTEGTAPCAATATSLYGPTAKRRSRASATTWARSSRSWLHASPQYGRCAGALLGRHTGCRGEFPAEESFPTFLEQALCFFAEETAYRSSPSPFGIKLVDRLSGIPLHLDISDEPIKRGITTNRNKFVLGPSGSGKSFFMNHLIRHYYERGRTCCLSTREIRIKDCANSSIAAHGARTVFT